MTVCELLYNSLIINRNNNPTVQTDNSSVAKLLKFKKQVEYYKANPNVKDGETMTVDEAVWNLENLFNITYTFPEYSYSELVTQEFELDIDATDGHILASDVAALYEELKNESRTLYANDGFTEDKGFLTLHAEILNTRGGEVVKVKITTGEKTNYNLHKPHVEGPFSSGNDTTLADNWIYGELLGNCDDASVISDAAHEIADKINDSILASQPIADYGQRYAFINRIPIDFTPSGYQGLFYTTEPDELCIKWYDMNDYWYKYNKIVYIYIPEKEPSVQGLELINVAIYGLKDESVIPAIMWHQGTANYGERVSLDESVFGDALDITNN